MKIDPEVIAGFFAAAEFPEGHGLRELEKNAKLYELNDLEWVGSRLGLCLQMLSKLAPDDPWHRWWVAQLMLAAAALEAKWPDDGAAEAARAAVLRGTVS